MFGNSKYYLYDLLTLNVPGCFVFSYGAISPCVVFSETLYSGLYINLRNTDNLFDYLGPFKKTTVSKEQKMTSY